jgi:HEAT repeat protein
MKLAPCYPWLVPPLALLVSLSSCHLVSLSDAWAESQTAEDERTLHSAGLSIDGPSLLAFFQARARTEVDREHLRQQLRQFTVGTREERGPATAELLGLGPLALPALRKAANDLDHPEAAARASRCLPWLEGPSSYRLLSAAARVMAQRKPDGAAAALLAYLPCADDSEVIATVSTALAAVAAAPDGKADPAVLRALTDPDGARRAAAGAALCHADPPDQAPAVRRLLTDPSPGVRLRAALALAEAHDGEAIPVLIDLLLELPLEQRKRVEEFLTQLAGEWAPVLPPQSEDKIARRIRRDAWASWWRNADGASLLAAVREHTLTPETRKRVAGLIAQLSNEEFTIREGATKELFALGWVCVPQLREAAKSRDSEVARRAEQLMERIELEPAHRLPLAALRLLAVRKPEGCVEALLAYLPYAEHETLSSELRKSLAALARRDGKPDPDLLSALTANDGVIRAAAAEALAKGGGVEGRAAARKLLADRTPDVRLRVALALTAAQDRDGVPALIDLLTVLSGDAVGQVEDALCQLAGDTAPEVSLGEKADEKKKCREAWSAWWKVNSERVDLSRLTVRPWLGYTLICDLNGNRVYEVDRKGQQRWVIANAGGPADARILPGNRVLIAEYGADRITERDFKGNILWERRIPNPVNVQRLSNGNTFIATNGGPILELDRSGKEVYAINNLPGNTLSANRSRHGGIVALTQSGQCLRMDTSGKQTKSFAAGHNGRCLGGIDLLPSGRVLVPQMQRGKVVEFDAEGKTILEVDAPNAMSATGLPNGHILVATQNHARVYEIDRAGKIVWEHNNAGQVFRARRR